MKAVLVANGVLSPDAEVYLRRSVNESDLIVGVDGGTYHLIRLGIQPHLVTGDFDSLLLEDRERLTSQGVHIYPTPDQDFTDLDKAFSVVIQEFGVQHLRIYGATGGRLDHLYSVLSVIVKYGRLADTRLVDEFGETFLIPGELEITGADLPGRTLSLLAMGKVEGITTTGLRWPLNDESLAPGVRDGTLNEVVSNTVQIRHRQGDLLAMLHHPVV